MVAQVGKSSSGLFELYHSLRGLGSGTVRARLLWGVGTSLRHPGADWVADTADDRLALERMTVYVPLRVVAKGEGCDLVLTLFRQPDMADEEFAADAEWVMRDLLVAKRILEAQ